MLEGVVHRDIQPGNIMLEAYGRARLGGFGLGHMYDTVRTQNTNPYVAETFVYASPEALLGELSPGVDIYALGMVLLELLCGKCCSSAKSATNSTVALPGFNAVVGAFQAFGESQVTLFVIGNEHLNNAPICGQENDSVSDWPPTARSVLYQLGNSCMSRVSKKRPTAAQVQHSTQYSSNYLHFSTKWISYPHCHRSCYSWKKF
jgi:serine/threonine protein kinase